VPRASADSWCGATKDPAAIFEDLLESSVDDEEIAIKKEEIENNGDVGDQPISNISCSRASISTTDFISCSQFGFQMNFLHIDYNVQLRRRLKGNANKDVIEPS